MREDNPVPMTDEQDAAQASLDALRIRSAAGFTDRRDCRSLEALARRREERLDRNPWVKPPRPTIVSVVPSTPKPPPVDDDLLLDAERRLETGARVVSDAFVADLKTAFRLSFDVAAGLVRELVSQGRLVRSVAPNGFTTLTRPTGSKARQKGRSNCADSHPGHRRS
jgi:hypothetical protein